MEKDAEKMRFEELHRTVRALEGDYGVIEFGEAGPPDVILELARLGIIDHIPEESIRAGRRMAIIASELTQYDRAHFNEYYARFEPENGYAGDDVAPEHDPFLVAVYGSQRIDIDRVDPDDETDERLSTQVELRASAIKGMDMAIAAIRQLQVRDIPKYIEYDGFTVPRPFVFEPNLPDYHGFWYGMRHLAPNAEHIQMGDKIPEDGYELAKIQEPLTIARSLFLDMDVELVYLPNSRVFYDDDRPKLMFAMSLPSTPDHVKEAFIGRAVSA